MKEGFVRCPLCGHPVAVSVNGFMKRHWATFSRSGYGARGNATPCKGSNKKAEDVK